MLAATYSEYGSPERLCVREVDTPTPGANDVLVRTAAVSLNASDVEFLRGRPAYVRAWGLRRPRHPILGSDVAGVVAAVGKNVTQFRPGDRVFADLLERWGGLAEYVCAPQELWAHIPEGLDFVQASMVPQAGVVALQALKAGGDITGKSVLINGAGGGSGTFALQFARRFGAARVTAVDHGHKLNALRKLGAHEVIDFTREDYCTRGPFDRIVDLVGSRSLADNARALSRDGKYFLVGGSVPRLLSALTLGTLRSLLTNRAYRLAIIDPAPIASREIAEQCVRGELSPVLGAVYSLHDVRAAFTAQAESEHVGKVVVRLDPAEDITA